LSDTITVKWRGKKGKGKTIGKFSFENHAKRRGRTEFEKRNTPPSFSRRLLVTINDKGGGKKRRAANLTRAKKGGGGGKRGDNWVAAGKTRI